MPGPSAAASAAPARRILVIDDEADLCEVLSHNLREAGYLVDVAASGREGMSVVERQSPHLVILDLMLPDVSGNDVCRWIRGRPGPQPAVIVLSARGSEIDRVVGFEIGADDYVVKPFSVRELVLRVGSLLRNKLGPSAERTATGPASPADNPRRRLRVGAAAIDVDGRSAEVGGQRVHLSAMEMRLLLYLVDHRGRVRSRKDLIRDVWENRHGISTRTVDTHVKRLRDKLDGAGHLVETVRGAGYRLADEEAAKDTGAT